MLIDISGLVREKKKEPKKFGCNYCGLSQDAYCPQFPPQGKGELGIAIVVDKISDKEDAIKQLLVTEAGQVLRQVFAKNKINIDRDCRVFPLVQCYKNGKLVQKDFNHCQDRVTKQLLDFKPEVIFVFGDEAIKQIFKESSVGVSQLTTHGSCVPYDKYSCRVVCSISPQHFINDRFNDKDYSLIEKAVKKGLKYVGKEYKSQKLEESYNLLLKIEDVNVLFDKLMTTDAPVTFDYETTGVDPYKPDFKILTAAFGFSEKLGYCVPILHPQKKWSDTELEHILTRLKSWLCSNKPKWIQNWAFEDIVSRVALKTKVENCVVDSMIMQHILDNRANITKQKFQCFVRYGANYDKDIDQNNLINTPLDVVAKYNVLDVLYVYRWISDMNKEMSDSLVYPLQLFMDNVRVFTDFTETGVKIDNRLLNRLNKDVIKEIEELDRIDKNTSFLEEYKKVYNQEFSEESPLRKQRLYFELLKLKPLKLTDTGKKKNKSIDDIRYCSTDAESMEYLLTQVEKGSEEWLFINKGLNLKKLIKLQSTYIKQFMKLQDGNNRIHPAFLLHRVSTYRSSSANPNFQNIPVRDAVLSRIREVVVPTNDYFYETDYAANEVRFLASITKDENLIYDVNNNVDFHKLYASILYEKPESAITKTERFNAKSYFVFATWYGSYPKTIARKNPQWRPYIIEKATNDLWARYPKVLEWHKSNHKEYLQKGYIQTPLGFRLTWGVSGAITPNNEKNSPIQATAFHRLLWAIPKIQREFIKRGLKSQLIGQIHDSLITDLCYAEIDIVTKIIQHYTLCVAGDWDNTVKKAIDFKIGTNFRNLMDMEDFEKQ